MQLTRTASFHSLHQDAANKHYRTSLPDRLKDQDAANKHYRTSLPDMID